MTASHARDGEKCSSAWRRDWEEVPKRLIVSGSSPLSSFRRLGTFLLDGKPSRTPLGHPVLEPRRPVTLAAEKRDRLIGPNAVGPRQYATISRLFGNVDNLRSSSAAGSDRANGRCPARYSSSGRTSSRMTSPLRARRGVDACRGGSAESRSVKYSRATSRTSASRFSELPKGDPELADGGIGEPVEDELSLPPRLDQLRGFQRF